MTAAHRRYLAGEMALAAVINAVLSAAFVFLMFGGRSVVPTAGWDGLAADAAPQSFMVALMSCLVPTALTRRRLRAGTVAPLAGGVRLPRLLVLRALLVAASVAVVATGVQALLLAGIAARWSLPAVYAFKCGYGALLGAAVAALAIRCAWGDAVSPASRQKKAA